MCGDLADLLNENAVIRSVRVAAFFFGPSPVQDSEAGGGVQETPFRRPLWSGGRGG